MIRNAIVVTAVGISVVVATLLATWLDGRPAARDLVVAQPPSYADVQRELDRADVVAPTSAHPVLSAFRAPIPAAYAPPAPSFGPVEDMLPLSLALGLAASALTVVAAVLASFRPFAGAPSDVRASFLTTSAGRPGRRR